MISNYCTEELSREILVVFFYMREGRELKHVFKSLFTVRFLECPYFGLVNPLSLRSH